MKLGFWFDYDQTYTFVRLHCWFTKRFQNARSSGFIVNDRYFAHATEHLPGSSLIALYELVKKGRRYTPTAEELAEFRSFDERERLARVAYSDRFVHTWKYAELIALFIYLRKEFRAYINRERPDVFIFNCVASQYAHLLYVILKDEGVPVLIPMFTGIEDLMYVTDNPYFDWPEVVDLFQAMREGSDRPLPEERTWAEQLIDRVRTGSATYSIAHGKVMESRKFLIPSPLRIGSYLRYLDNYRKYDRHDPTLPSPVERLRSLIRLRSTRKKAVRYFKEASATGERFLFYPLHYDPEIATLVLSQYDQASVIDMIARQLPLTWRLVLREHPLLVGQRPLSFYERILGRYPNAIFVRPDSPMDDLLKRASVVFTLSGTTILDSLILRRPVIYTSRSRFGAFDLGRFTHNLIDFGAILASAEAWIATDDELIFMLAAIRRFGARYNFVEPLGDMSVLDASNIEKMGNALLARIKAA